MPDSFLTLAAPGRAELRVKASRFFGYAEEAGEELAASAMRQRLKKEFHDADHQPFALRLASGLVRSSDDGEPKGTAGIPILSQIQRLELCNVQVVVVRYFGGTKLGKGGLVQAFGECARVALENAGQRREQICRYFDLTVAPELVNSVKAIAARFDAIIVAVSYAEQAHLRLSVPASRFEECREGLVQRFGEKMTIR